MLQTLFLTSIAQREQVAVEHRHRFFIVVGAEDFLERAKVLVDVRLQHGVLMSLNEVLHCVEQCIALLAVGDKVLELPPQLSFLFGVTERCLTTEQQMFIEDF